MKRYAKSLVTELESLGYEFDRVNSKGMHIYVLGGKPDLPVSPGVNEQTARHILTSIKRSLGCADEVSKRNPTQVKERQAADREHASRELERLERKREEFIAKRGRLLAGKATGLTRNEIRSIQFRLEEMDRERRHWESLMTSTPASSDHRGTAQPRHRSGAA